MASENLIATGDIFIPFGKLAIIPTKGCEDLAEMINTEIVKLREKEFSSPEYTENILFNDCLTKNYVKNGSFIRFQTGEGKCELPESVRGYDVYIVCDVFNRNVMTKFYSNEADRPMSPDEHFCDLKRLIDAINGKAKRVTVIMPMLYEGRQHRRTKRESQDCANALVELTSMGVDNIITFDAHDPRVQNAITLHTFEDISTRHQMIKALNEFGKKQAAEKAKDENDARTNYKIDPHKLTIISPDEGGLSRALKYANVLHVPLGTFYKRRDYSTVVDGKNPILEHKYLGDKSDIEGKDIVIVDDMISSGSSIFEVVDALHKMNARRIFVCCAFGLYTEGFKKFDEYFNAQKITQVFNTNLVHPVNELLDKPWYTSVNMCKYIAFIINNLNTDRTLSNLINPDKRITDRLYEKYPEMWKEWLDEKKAEMENLKAKKQG